MSNPIATLVNWSYNTISGTSMATPFVSGVAALLWATKPDAAMTQIKDIIIQSVDEVDPLIGKTITGGRLNAYKALSRLAESVALELVLKKGWNFVSFPCLSADGIEIDLMLKDVKDSIKIIWGYDNYLKQWMKYRPHATGNTLNKFEPGKGYWVYMNEEVILKTTGELPYLPLIPLYGGWNLVGYTGAERNEVKSALSSIKGLWEIIWGWEDGNWFARLNLFENLSIPVYPLDELKTNRAYWLKMEQPERTTNWVQ